MPRCKRLPEVKDVYLNEISFLEQADHPNILKMQEYSDTAKWADSNMTLLPVYFIELEHWEYGELYEIIEGTGKFGDKEARFYFHQLISAIEYMHGQGYAHWDVKTENLLLDVNFNLKLADWGFATKEIIWTEK